MAAAVRRQGLRVGRSIRVLMDLGGPKLRTGPIAAGPAVAKLQPERDAWGRVSRPARLGLRPSGSQQPVPGADLTLGADLAWLARLEEGARVILTDARGSTRRLEVMARFGDTLLLHADQTAYLSAQVCLRLHKRGRDIYKTWLSDVPQPPGQLLLRRGDRLHVVSEGVGRNGAKRAKGQRPGPALIACTLPEALPMVRKGERIWFDDGRIGGVVTRAGAKRLEVEITDAREQGERLAADKGINLPDSRLDLAALRPQDLDDLALVAQCADLVGMSFAQSADDVAALRARLAELGAGHVAVLLKIETRRGFEQLPELLLAAMAGPLAGVMIARGDLAVECGYERLAEVQEEILWACEAAHMPVVWATQVLETLARTGLPSRAEITDAAMGGRAECVMLNKGPHIVEAMHTLDDILTRMQGHQTKKRSLLRALRSWDLPPRRKSSKRG
jgi:pyruvate kinase